jgi:hypothetical protein
LCTYLLQTAYSACTDIKADDGTLYDLTGIPTVSGKDPQDSYGWQYSANPCTPLTSPCDVCNMDAGYCQVNPSRTSFFCVGAVATVTFSGQAGGTGVIANFVAPADKTGLVRKGTLTITCDPTITGTPPSKETF